MKNPRHNLLQAASIGLIPAFYSLDVSAFSIYDIMLLMSLLRQGMRIGINQR